MSGIPDSLTDLTVAIDALVPYGKNPRTGDVSAIMQSLKVNGQYRPVVVNSRTNEVLAGNHTLRAARELGWPEIAATFIDADDETAARIVLVDNRSNDLATYDDPVLASLLSDMTSLDGTGYGDEDLTEILARITELPPPLPDPDAVPTTPSKPKSKRGDIWILGPHRVGCGDSSDITFLDAVMEGAMADLVWTDPPYGVAYEAAGHEPIANDDLGVGDLTDFLRETLGAALQACRPGACWYVAAPAGPAFLAFGIVLTELGIWRQTLAWVKNAIVMGRSDFHYKHEAIFYGSAGGEDDPRPIPPDASLYDDVNESIAYGWAPGAAHQAPPDRKQSSVWEFPKPKANKEHPTMKPVALIEKALVNSTNRGDVVLDIFGGSGSTLIACHQQGRSARLIELEPRYVDVICHRYQDATGVEPILESSGEPHDFG